MKTIRQIAGEIGVSKQAIFYRIKKPPLSNVLQSLVSKENGVLAVSFDGEKLIKQAFSFNVTVKKPSKRNTPFDGASAKILCDVVDVLKLQLKEKDKQIAELTATVKMQIENTNKPQMKRSYFNKKPITASRTSNPIKRLMSIEL